MQHANSTDSKQERARTWDHILARLSMPALGKVKNISLKVESVKLFLSFITNRHRIFKSWSEIEDSPKHKNTSESQNMQGRRLKLTKFLSENIPIHNNALMWIHIAFHVNVLSITKVIGSRIDGV